MTDIEKAMRVREITESDDDEAVLLSFLDLAKHRILNRLYPFHDVSRAEVPARYEALQIDIAVYLLNKRGAEGETQHIENGIHRNYGEADVPASLLFQITPMCGSLGWSNEVPEPQDSGVVNP